MNLNRAYIDILQTLETNTDNKHKSYIVLFGARGGGIEEDRGPLRPLGYIRHRLQLGAVEACVHAHCLHVPD